MRRVFLIFCIFTFTGSFPIPAYSQLDSSCVSDYLEQIVSVAESGEVAALDEIMSLVQDAQLRCLADDDILMLKSDGTIHQIEDVNCSVYLKVNKSRERDHFRVQLGFSGESRDDFFFDLFRDGERFTEETSGTYAAFDNSRDMLHSGPSYDLTSLFQEERGTYLVVYEDMVTLVPYRVGFEVTRPGTYNTVFGCTVSEE